MSVNPGPSAPNLEFYRKQAKALLRSAQAADPQTLTRIRAQEPRADLESLRLADAQRILARENGFASWPRLKQHVESASRMPEAPNEKVAGGAEKAGKSAAIGDDAVRAKTGKGWDEWFALLDAAGADRMSHKEIVAIAHEHGAGSWWQQMVTVTYEQARGLRSKNMSCDGDYQVSVSKTVNAPAERIFEAWHDPAVRQQFLPAAEMTIRKATSPKSLRVTWHQGGNLDVMIYPKGDRKCQCTVDHKKLAGPEEVDRMRAHWGAALDRLKALLEG